MLTVYFGDMVDVVYNMSVYFKFNYEPSWLEDPFVQEMILDVDSSHVLGNGAISSTVLGVIVPVTLSGGVKTLIRFAHIACDTAYLWRSRAAAARNLVQRPYLRKRAFVQVDGLFLVGSNQEQPRELPEVQVHAGCGAGRPPGERKPNMPCAWRELMADGPPPWA